MILAETSVWIDHLRDADPTLQGLLEARRVVCHPFVIGEIATGSFRNREAVLSLLQQLPKAIVAQDKEVLRFISEHRLFGLGVGYIDLHLLLAVKLTPDARLWTRDRRMLAAARSMDISFD